MAVPWRVLVGAGLLVWVGAALILAALPRLSRPTLSERLRPFHPGGTADRQSNPLSAGSVRQVLVPLAEDVGARAAALFGVTEPAERRLRRIHSPIPSGLFRLRQVAWSGASALVGAMLSAVTRPPWPLVALLVAGAPLLTFLAVEQGLARRSERWQAALADELPVVAEQLAMLLNAGYSLGSGVARLAGRGSGCAARDLARVVNRSQQGLPLGDALREWADLAGVESVQRLVSVMAVHSEVADLGRLVLAEARESRREQHRRAVEVMERRAQMVWVPVTVATLIPGAILLAVPFLAALRLFANA